MNEKRLEVSFSRTDEKGNKKLIYGHVYDKFIGAKKITNRCFSPSGYTSGTTDTFIQVDYYLILSLGNNRETYVVECSKVNIIPDKY